MMQPDQIRDWLSVVALLISASSSIYVWMTARSKANSNEISKVSRRLDEVEHDRIEKLEKDLGIIQAEWKHLPDQESVHKLQLTITEVQGQLIGMAKESEGTHRALTRIEQFLLENKGSSK